LAAVRLFAAHGDREHRSRARLRHVRQRVGDGEFLAMLQETFAAVKAERDWPRQEVRQAGPQLPASVPMTFANGDVTPDAARGLADLIERDGLEVRIANHHQVVAFGRGEAEIRRALASSGPLAAAAAPQPVVVACPGARWCSRALTDTNSLADALRDRLRGHALPGLTVCISGCPNGCAHSRVADVGLVGVRATVDGQSTDAYDLFAHGGMGRTPELAQPVARKLSAGQAIGEVAKLAEQFGESQAAGRHRAD
jgi:sulfite reductase beta subunit-like hemoprotein